MRHLCLLGCVLLLGLGCAGDGQKGQWDEFWKDLRGDNMRMRSDVAAERAERASHLKPED